MVTTDLATRPGLASDSSPDATQKLIFGEDVVDGPDYKALRATK
ncbi:hypothetical protein [Rhodococcus sp. ACS1]|nr:hypothetical protein [Rhodococcus sp. ACS1]